jgi:hypothetical protein
LVLSAEHDDGWKRRRRGSTVVWEVEISANNRILIGGLVGLCITARGVWLRAFRILIWL